MLRGSDGVANCAGGFHIRRQVLVSSTLRPFHLAATKGGLLQRLAARTVDTVVEQ